MQNRKGKFLKSGTFSRIWDNRPCIAHTGSGPLIDNSVATRRDYYEMGEISNQESEPETTSGDLTSVMTSQHPLHKKQGPVQATVSESASRGGYWDVLSIFRSTNQNSTQRSETNLESQSGHP